MGAKASIRRILDTFVVGRFVSIRKGVRVPDGHDLILGQGACVDGDVAGARSVYLAKGARVTGSIEAALDIVVGASARVEGHVVAGGNVLLLEGAEVLGHVETKGRARIVGARAPGGVRALGDVEVRGESDLSKIEAGGRILSMPSPAPLET